MRSKRRAIFLWILFFAVILIAGNALLFVEKPPLNIAPDQPALPLCTSNVASADNSQPAENLLRRIQIVSTGDYGQIAFVPAREVGDACEVLITAGPPKNETKKDWRIGLSIDDPALYGGKEIQFTFALEADDDMNFTTSSYYIHDGLAGVSGGVPPVPGGKQTLATLKHTVSVGAPVLEFWLRLVSPNAEEPRLPTGTLRIRNIYLEVLE